MESLDSAPFRCTGHAAHFVCKVHKSPRSPHDVITLRNYAQFTVLLTCLFSDHTDDIPFTPGVCAALYVHMRQEDV